MNNRITPELITELKPNEIFVFGSNSSAVHGRGAAKQAVKFGASKKVAQGFSGNTYAIITRKFLNGGPGNYKLETLSLFEIEVNVLKFVGAALYRPDLTFLVTPIGCGLAGYEPKDIAPMFNYVIDKEHIHLPESFWKILKP